MKRTITWLALFSILLLQSNLLAQNLSSPENIEPYKISSKRYVTDESGNILMQVNVWGHVNKPGNHLVYDGIDLATLLSVVGGPMKGADLETVHLYREVPDENGQIAYEINLKDFYHTGDRGNFLPIKPNDTLVFYQTKVSFVLSYAGTLNTILSILNLYFLIEQRNK